MKAGWSETVLGEVCQIQSGAGFPLVHQGHPEGDFPFFKVGDMNTAGNEEYLIQTPNHISEELRKTLGAKILPPASIVFPKVGGAIATNKKRRIKVPSCVDNNVMGLIPKQERIAPDFLAWWMHGVDIYEFSNKANPPSITQATVRDWPIPLPPLEEQQRIVAVLDEAFEGLARARAHAEANLQNARELFNAELEKIFDVELADEDRATFENITKDTLIGLVRSKKEQGPEREYDYAKMNNIGNDDRFVGPILDRVDCTPEEASRFQLCGGDFLFNTRNSRELVGKSCVVEADFQRPTVFNNNVMRVRFGSGVSSRFVALAFKSKHAKAQLEAMKSGITNVVAIYHKSLKTLTLPMPSLEIQKALVDRFEELDTAIQRLISNYSEQVEDTGDLRQSLLQKAFAGELT